MSVSRSVASDDQLARLLQIGVVLEELVEARAYEHYRALVEAGGEVDDDVEDLLMEAREESGEHRERLEGLIDALEAESVPYAEIESLVREKYGLADSGGLEAVLYDQLSSEETAYNFYDGVIDAIEASDVTYALDRARLLSTLRSIRAEEAEGVEEVTAVIEAR